jgi:hypothetical protein
MIGRMVIGVRFVHTWIVLVLVINNGEEVNPSNLTVKHGKIEITKKILEIVTIIGV